VREVGGIEDAVGLKKMATFVTDNDLEARADSEANSPDKGIPEANVIDVLSACAEKEFAAGFVSSKKALENGKRDARRGPDLRRGWSTLGLRRRLDKAANKPAPKPSGSNLLDRGIRLLI